MLVERPAQGEGCFTLSICLAKRTIAIWPSLADLVSLSSLLVLSPLAVSRTQQAGTCTNVWSFPHHSRDFFCSWWRVAPRYSRAQSRNTCTQWWLLLQFSNPLQWADGRRAHRMHTERRICAAVQQVDHEDEPYPDRKVVFLSSRCCVHQDQAFHQDDDHQCLQIRDACTRRRC